MRPDVPALVSGLAVAALGAVLLPDRLGELDLDFATAAPVVLATLGVVLLATGFAKRDLDT